MSSCVVFSNYWPTSKTDAVILAQHFITMDVCAICRGELSTKCSIHSPESGCTPEQCAGNNEVTCNLLCKPIKHNYHTCCIREWRARRDICPLCTRPWEDMKVLSLIELCALKFLGDIDFLIKIDKIQIDNKVYTILKKYSRPGMSITPKSRPCMELMSIYSSQYLTLDDAKKIVETKTMHQKIDDCSKK